MPADVVPLAPMRSPRGRTLAAVLVLTVSGLVTPASVAGADPVVVGAGDIADCGTTADSATAALVDHIAGTVVVIGDNVYPSGTAAYYHDCYDPTWGRFKARTKPASGNHEYLVSGATGYFGYFGGAAGDPSKGYYSYDLGTWHIVVLNSNCSFVGCSSTSAQAGWLRANLAANKGKDVLAYWHHPRFSSGTHGSSAILQPLWEILYAAGADVILNGHDHDYERFARQDPWGRADTPFGIREFVVGTGGGGLRARNWTAPNSQAFSSTHGVLKLTLRKGAYDWSFVPIAGSTFTDSGTATTHGAPPAWTTRTFAVGSDAYVDQAHPDTAYGPSSRLLVDGDAGGGLGTARLSQGDGERAEWHGPAGGAAAVGPRPDDGRTEDLPDHDDLVRGEPDLAEPPGRHRPVRLGCRPDRRRLVGRARRHLDRSHERHVRLPALSDVHERRRIRVAPGRPSTPADRPDRRRSLIRRRLAQSACGRRVSSGRPSAVSGTDPRQSCAPPRRPREEPWTTSPFSSRPSRSV